MATIPERKRRRRSNDTARGIMNEKIPTVSMEATVADVEHLLLEKAKQFDSILYVYVLDEAEKLRGVISVKDVFREPKGMPVSRFMQKAVVLAKPGAHKERIAYLALRNNIKAIPIVDKEGVFLGAVTGDVILETLYREMSEDIFRFAGVPGAHRNARNYDDVMHLTVARALLHRLPWLLIGLLGGMGIAKIIGHYDALLTEHLILAAFIPLVAYTAAAAAAQTNAFVIRDMAIGARIRFTDYFFKELKNDFLIAAITGLTLFGILATLGSWLLAAAVGTALFVAVLSSILTGLLVPYAFARFKLDPANGTGPMATILQDALSVTIYFTVASLFF